MRITTTTATATALAAVMLAACGSDDGDGGDDSSSGTSSIVWDMWAGSEEDTAFLNDTLEIVRAENPDIDVQLQTAPWNDYFTKLTTNLSAGNVACVTSMNGQRLSSYAEAFMPLTPEDLETAGLSEDDFVDGALDIMTHDGQLYGLPFDVATMLVYYNKDMFADSGAPEPQIGWSFEDFESAAQSVSTDDHKGFGIGMAEFQWMSLPIAMSGKQPVDEEGNLALTDPDFVDAATWYAGLVTEQEVAAPPPSASETGWGETEYAAGNVAMAVDGTWNAVTYLNNDTGFAAGMTNLPAGDAGSTALVLGSGYGIAADCADKEAALQVLGSLLGKDAQDAMASSGRSYPARAESQPLYFESLDDAVRDEVQAAFEAAFADVEGQRSTDDWDQVNTAIQPQLVSVYTGQAGMGDMLEQVQQQFGN
ncbi:ABC transporter substrate-binding protein [Phytoactinopolyspora halotolerans]|uniref:Sugar ABC transporter substrate-binding protein n=1 Tax=Phytoactinopolyspora halotolerans TaxID=1981512 RepID=A0A6L9S3A3_9ACTN|nr:sugar ABC transporter substrate-binding protein [Phytoactinopolyspora halotolerans]NED99665.1 sugar ABC transporter substrate-binding protein [Phytoactinopolyspora halotolerans]